MAKVFTCEKCGGMPIRAETDGELTEMVQNHMKETHEMEISGEEVLQMATVEEGSKPWWKLW